MRYDHVTLAGHKITLNHHKFGSSGLAVQVMPLAVHVMVSNIRNTTECSIKVKARARSVMPHAASPGVCRILADQRWGGEGS